MRHKEKEKTQRKREKDRNEQKERERVGHVQGTSSPTSNSCYRTRT